MFYAKETVLEIELQLFYGAKIFLKLWWCHNHGHALFGDY